MPQEAIRVHHPLFTLCTSLLAALFTVRNMKKLAEALDELTLDSLESDSLYLRRLQVSTMLSGLNAMLNSQYLIISHFAFFISHLSCVRAYVSDGQNDLV